MRLCEVSNPASLKVKDRLRYPHSYSRTDVVKPQTLRRQPQFQTETFAQSVPFISEVDISWYYLVWIYFSCATLEYFLILIVIRTKRVGRILMDFLRLFELQPFWYCTYLSSSFWYFAAWRFRCTLSSHFQLVSDVIFSLKRTRCTDGLRTKVFFSILTLIKRGTGTSRGSIISLGLCTTTATPTDSLFSFLLL